MTLLSVIVSMRTGASEIRYTHREMSQERTVEEISKSEESFQKKMRQVDGDNEDLNQE